MSDWIFVHLFKKDFAQRDLLLLVWSAVALVTAFRDQLYYFLVTRARFRLTASITSASALVALVVSILALRQFGVIGALVGLLAGELFNVVGIVIFSLREARRMPTELAKAV
jgi:O-antigen/teichoic acid export membrane protein